MMKRYLPTRYALSTLGMFTLCLEDRNSLQVESWLAGWLRLFFPIDYSGSYVTKSCPGLITIPSWGQSTCQQLEDSAERSEGYDYAAKLATFWA
jgi:hypothetical protein